VTDIDYATFVGMHQNRHRVLHRRALAVALGIATVFGQDGVPKEMEDAAR